MTTARNLPGLLAVPFLLVLMTECQPKLDAALISTTPVDAVPVDAELSLRFTRPIDPESADPPLHWEPSRSVWYRWNDDHTVLTFAPRGG